MGCGASAEKQDKAKAEASAEKQDEKKDKQEVAEAEEGGGVAWTPDAFNDVRNIRGKRKNKDQKVKRNEKANRSEARNIDWACADPDKWEMVEKEFNGGFSYKTAPELVQETGSIADALQKVKEDPLTWMGIYYQTNMTEWPEDQQTYTLIRRTKSGFCVQTSEDAGFTFIRAKYKALPPCEEVSPIDFSSSAIGYHGSELPPPLCPGRGQGVADVPMIKIMGDVDPNDISQGGVGDCWLLSAISALAEYDGAIHRLFKNSEGIAEKPSEEPNYYTVTLYDLQSWEPVDVQVDEGLCSNEHGTGILGCSPTITGELWACYLEKAVAKHCGSWDKIDGGQCTHAWRLLTGCKDQYTLRCTDGRYGCFGAWNPNEDRWEELANSPHDGFKGLWPMKWPEVGGGGNMDLTVGPDEMFERMCAWDDENYIMGCGTKAGSDTEDTDGIVDGHAYTILACESNAGGTDWDLVKVRNPWGKGEFKSGQWDDDGPGWDEFPQVREACKPVKADDGVFWVSKQEFFEYFQTIYLCAMDMSRFA